MTVFLWILGTIGHLGVWAAIFNQIHSTACPRKTRKLSEKILIALALFPLLAVGLLFLISGWQRSPGLSWIEHIEAFSALLLAGPSRVFNALFQIYAALCLVVAILLAGRWLYRRVFTGAMPAVVQRKSETIRVRPGQTPLVRGWFPRLLGLIPFNQVLQIQVERATWTLNIPPVFDGLKILHLSDLHLTGDIDLAFFEQAVDLGNQFEPDLILITGDLLDCDECIPWVQPIFGSLRSKLGIYFVLGNHDRRVVDLTRLLSEMKRAGCQHLNSGWVELSMPEGSEEKLLLAGNELPWFPGAEKLPPNRSASNFKILLSHSPDQVDWARKLGFDLMLAGHTHGGQIVFPLLGPIISPSRYGVKFAAGTFQEGNFLMHVSRGLSGDKPIRINCPPEMGLFTIRSAQL